MKKIVILSVTIIMMLCLSINSFAATDARNDSYINDSSKEEIKDTFTFNEYDMYVSLKKDNLVYRNILNIEQELLNRKNLSDNELKAQFGYDDKQIEILRNYNGRPLELAPETRDLFATLSCTIQNMGSTSTRANFRFYWVWNMAPTILANDMIGIYTHALDNGAEKIGTDYINTSCSIDYYTNAGTYIKTSYVNVNNAYGEETLATTIPMGDNTGCYAKSGFIYGSIIPEASGGAMVDVRVYASYGHSILSIYPSFTISLSGVVPTFSFVAQMHEAGEAYNQLLDLA